MSAEISKRVELLFRPNKPVIAKTDEILFARNIVYLTTSGGKTFAVKANRKKVELAANLNFYERFYKGYFLRVHRSYLVAVDRIEGIFERFPDEPVETDDEKTIRAKADECELGLIGTNKRIPVTETYSRKLKKVLGITSLEHVVPDHPDDKKLRAYGLIDFGWRELYNLDSSNPAAVEDFRQKWDIKQFSKKRMLSYFRHFGANRINTKRVIKNIIYQLYRWIKKGIEEPSDGNIRSLWYRIKSVLAYHSNVLESGDVDTFYSTLQEMIEDQGLFRYKDFGFMDMNEPYREIGKKLPEVILASEKTGHYLFIKQLAAEVGVSFICMKGEPAAISLEYFGDDLMQACGDKPKTVLCISDVDPAGYSIENNLVLGLQRNGHKIKKVIKLVDASAFLTQEIAVLRYPVVSYEVKGNKIKAVAPATMGQVTKGRSWFELIDDARLISEKEKNGWKVVTIWGIESDAADREIIRKRFFAGVGIAAKKPRKKKD